MYSHPFHSFFKIISSTFILLGFCIEANSQIVFDPIRPQKKLVPVPVNISITIDGALNEPEWSTIPITDDFVEINPVQGGVPSQRTIVKLAYNSTYLYVATICMDSSMQTLRVPDFKRDFAPVDHDHFAITIDGFRDERNAMAFLFNPFGVQRDVLCFDDRFFDEEWDALWQVRTQRTDTAWTAEVAIPWKTLRYPVTKETFQTWGINFCRLRRSTNEYYSWSPFPRAYTLTRMSYEGLLDSIQVPSSTTNIRTQPYTLLSSTKEHRTGKWNTVLKAGGEAKWALSSNKVLDLTFNTDFAQADVDQQVNNVQRFSFYFPEKRQFFLENASLLRPGLDVNPDGNKGTQMVIQPFFSRRVGLDDQGQPIPIQVGARYIQRSQGFNIGVMSLRQASNDSLAPTSFFIGRYTKNIGRNNTIGTLITSRIQEGEAGKQPRYSNWSGSVDGFFRINQKLQMNGLLSGTTNYGKEGKGLAGYAQLFYKSDRVTIWWNQSFVTKNYSPEAGFVNRKNVVVTSPGIYWVIRDPWLPKFARSFGPGVLTDFVQTATTGKLEEASIDAYPVYFSYNNGGYIGFSIKYQYHRLSVPFSPLNATIDKGVYSFAHFHFMWSTDQSKKWSTSVETTTGGFYNGRLNYIIWNTRFSPMPHLALSSRIERYGLKNAGTTRLTADYYLYTLQSRISLTPRLQTFLLYQKNTVGNTDGLNVRFSWEYKPLSYVYLVFNNRSWIENGLKDQAMNSIVKINFLKQF